MSLDRSILLLNDGNAGLNTSSAFGDSATLARYQHSLLDPSAAGGLFIKGSYSLLGSESLAKNSLASIDLGIGVSFAEKHIFAAESFEGAFTANLHFSIDSISPSVELSNQTGENGGQTHFIHHTVDGNGQPVAGGGFDPRSGSGASVYDLDGDGKADHISHTIHDGKAGDADGGGNNTFSLVSTLATVDLDAKFSKSGAGLVTLVDSGNSLPASLNLQAVLAARADSVQDIGYVILDANEIDDASSILSDFNQLQSRSVSLFSSLGGSKTSLHEAFLFERSLTLTNGQAIKFFSVKEANFSDLTSTNDNRFAWLDQSIDSKGALTISGENKISIGLSQVTSDPGINALIAQQQQSSGAILDLTSFNGVTLTGQRQMAREADFDSVIGFYRVIDSAGNVLADDGVTIISAGQEGYAKAALSEANRVTALGNFSLEDDATGEEDFAITENGYIAPFAIANENTFFAFDEANPDKTSHFRTFGDNQIGFEDQYGGGDFDYDDFIVAFDFDATSLA